MAVEPSSVVRYVKVLRVIGEKWSDGPDREQLYREAGIEDWATYVARSLGEQLERVDELERVVIRLRSDFVRERVVGNYADAARREPLEGRREMLGVGTVQTILSDEPSDKIAKAQRTLLELDPEDLELLVGLYRHPHEDPSIVDHTLAADGGYGNKGYGEYRQMILQAGYLEGTNLLRTGCVRERLKVSKLRPARFGRATTGDVGPKGISDVEPVIEITPIGLRLLRFLGHAVAPLERPTPSSASTPGFLVRRRRRKP